MWAGKEVEVRLASAARHKWPEICETKRSPYKGVMDAANHGIFFRVCIAVQVHLMTDFQAPFVSVLRVLSRCGSRFGAPSSCSASLLQLSTAGEVGWRLQLGVFWGGSEDIHRLPAVAKLSMVTLCGLTLCWLPFGFKFFLFVSCIFVRFGAIVSLCPSSFLPPPTAHPSPPSTSFLILFFSLPSCPPHRHPPRPWGCKRGRTGSRRRLGRASPCPRVCRPGRWASTAGWRE